MKIYRAKGNREFEVDTQAEVLDTKKVKLKISTILPTLSDINVYEGKAAIRIYPRVPCHMATAIVSEDNEEYGLKRGSKVILNPYMNAGSESEKLSQAKIYGLDGDGFLRDFISMPIESIIPFPEEVKESEAVFTKAVAVALKAINTFGIKEGEYVAVIGGSVLSSIIAQLVSYYQGIPIYITNEARHIEIAEKCGIHYIIDESREDAYQRVLEITGGRMAESTIMHAKGGVSPHFLFSLAGRGGNCVIASLGPTVPKMETDISLISRKKLNVQGISSGRGEVNSAVNIIAQKVIDFSHFIDKTVSFDEVKVLFDEIADNPLRYVAPVIKVE